MLEVNDFFSAKNTVHRLTEEDREGTKNYLQCIEAFSRTTYKSIYVIDYKEKGFEYVSDNPLFLCGHTPQEVIELGYSFYFKYVPEQDLELLLKINDVGFNFYDQIPLEDRKHYTISYDFHLKNPNGKTILINQKLTPLFLNSRGKIWKAICLVSLSSAGNSGNIKIYKKGTNEIFTYNLKEDYWSKSEKVKLTAREKEILELSARGYTISEIAENIFVSPDTVKFHRRKIFDKLEVTNISEALTYAINNKLI